jgi:hypothetical protein
MTQTTVLQIPSIALTDDHGSDSLARTSGSAAPIRPERERPTPFWAIQVVLL